MTVNDRQEPEDEDRYDGEYDGGGIGCYNCSGGWHHTCCDDLCRNCNEAEDCEDGGRPCKLCNPDGESGSW